MGPGSGAMPLENRFVIFVVFVRDVNNNGYYREETCLRSLRAGNQQTPLHILVKIMKLCIRQVSFTFHRVNK